MVGLQIFLNKNLEHEIYTLDKTTKLNGNKKHYRMDINGEELLDVFSELNPEIVIHLAAKPGVRTNFSDSEEYEIINIQGFRNIIKLSREYSVSKFIYASSSSVYGGLSKTPFKEEAELSIPKSYYALSKILNETV